MEEQKKKYSLKKHIDNDAITYCYECKLYMCNKCESHHSELFENHHKYSIDEINKEIFTGFCNEENHLNKLEYFCKTHNKLCCAECIINIKHKGNGKHKECNICVIEDIKEEKKNKLNENIKNLQELSNILDESINKLKIIFEKINENKEDLKLKIQKIFTKLRNALNEREDKMLLEVEKKYDDIYFSGNIIKDNEKLPNKIKSILKKEKNININKNWDDDNQLTSMINDCINIENYIEKIKVINQNIKKCNLNNNLKFKFYPEEDNEINNFLETIKSFGRISFPNIFKFKKCPSNINKKRKYLITGENNNILTKTGTNYEWMGTICEDELEKFQEYRWKIKILKTEYFNIMIGVAPIDFDISSSLYTNCGWYFYCFNSKLRSGPPFNYNKETNIKKIKDEIIVVLNMNKKTLKFIIDNEDKGDSYTDIPTDKPLAPAIFLYDIYDSVEITEL